jgi:alanyl-tRNA synthetase
MKNAKAVRSAFLDYFAKQGHTVVRSSSLVPENDPTLMFTNAGMNQFKDVFTGRESRPYKRATSSQKCVRAGGKHNDLENVGFTARHHTFFEMLGNFSFGDYFKADAIEFAYQLIVKELGIDPSRLMYTVFGGDPDVPGVGPDDEAAKLWKKVTGVSDDRIVKLGKSENFWQMGEVGPMGPCTELHYHQGDDLPCSAPVCLGPACDCDRWLEIWNLVFMQYERKEPGGPLGKLPAPSVDTGAGLERVTAVVNGYRSNYETDLFVPLIARTAELATKKILSDAGDLASLRVIADHARATAFLVADGVQPDKGAREYVLRRIFRRAVRHGRKLGIDQPFMFEVCNAVVDLMGDDYPELRERQKVIEKVARDEEIRFRETLDRGLDLLEDEFERLKKGGEKVVPGAKVFQLHDTFGFPSDLTAVIAAERGFSADTAGFETEMAAAQARSAFKGEGEAVETVYKELAGKLPGTRFLGYDAAEGGTLASGKVLALVVDGKPAESATSGQSVRVIVDQTPFYASSGGQIGDTGKVYSKGLEGKALEGKGVEIEIVDTQKPAGDLFVLFGTVRSGQVKIGDELEQRVDATRRDMIRANHSATHLLHHALHQVIGEHATQKGSLVAPDRLRFDFSHGAPLTAEEKQRLEDLVNAEIRRNLDTRTEVLPIEQARSKGAMQMFGEKYGDKVRVVSIGSESLEFCGGTHVRRAGDIGLFKILGEAGVAQGVRRLEAVTGAGALEYVRRMEGELARASERLKGSPFEVASRVERLTESLRARDKEIDELKKKLATGGGRDLMSDVRDVGGVKVLAQRTEVADAKALRDVGDQLRDKLGSGVVVLFGVADGKVSLLTMVSKDLVGKLHAGKLAGELAAMVGGKGGGRPDMAQAGGSDPSKVDAAIARAFELVAAAS